MPSIIFVIYKLSAILEEFYCHFPLVSEYNFLYLEKSEKMAYYPYNFSDFNLCSVIVSGISFWNLLLSCGRVRMQQFYLLHSYLFHGAAQRLPTFAGLL